MVSDGRYHTVLVLGLIISFDVHSNSAQTTEIGTRPYRTPPTTTSIQCCALARSSILFTKGPLLVSQGVLPSGTICTVHFYLVSPNSMLRLFSQYLIHTVMHRLPSRSSSQVRGRSHFWTTELVSSKSAACKRAMALSPELICGSPYFCLFSLHIRNLFTISDSNTAHFYLFCASYSGIGAGQVDRLRFMASTRILVGVVTMGKVWAKPNSLQTIPNFYRRSKLVRDIRKIWYSRSRGKQKASCIWNQGSPYLRLSGNVKRYTTTLTPFHSAGSNSVKPVPPILLFMPGEMDSKLSSCVKVIKSPTKQCQLRKAHGNFL